MFQAMVIDYRKDISRHAWIAASRLYAPDSKLVHEVIPAKERLFERGMGYSLGSTR